MTRQTVGDLIAAMNKKHPAHDVSRNYNFYEQTHFALVPLARELETENFNLRYEIGSLIAENRAMKAMALDRMKQDREQAMRAQARAELEL